MSRSLQVQALATVAVLGGCRGEDIFFDCLEQKAAFEAAAEKEGKLADVPADGPYPMTLTFSKEGARTIMRATIDENVPFTEQTDYGFISLSFVPDSELRLDFADPAVCETCVVLGLDFIFTAHSGEDVVSSGIGDIEIAVPVVLEQGEGRATSLVAAYDKAEVVDMHMSFVGFESGDYDGVEGAFEILMTETIREDFGPIELISFDSWTLGDDDIDLVARDVAISPEHQTLTVGMQTNLALKDDAGFPLDTELEEEIPMRLSMHPSVLHRVSQRMLREGHIPRRYDDEGHADPDGNHGVTLTSMDGSPASSRDRLDSSFRLWRIDEGYCGYAVVAMPLVLGLQGNDIGVKAGEIRVVDGRGVGAVAAEEDELVEQNRHLAEIFKGSLAEQLALTLNYDSLDIQGKRLIFDTTAVAADPETVDVDLRFVIVAK